VEKTGPHSGTVKKNDVSVRIGSFQSDMKSTEQRRLQQGDAVVIKGEKTLAGEKWYQIAPPPGEYRWIEKKALTAPPENTAPAASREKPAAETGTAAAPLATGTAAPPAATAAASPRTARRPETDEKEAAFAADDPPPARHTTARSDAPPAQPPASAERGSSESTESATPAQVQAAMTQHLAAMDAEFRQMIELDPDRWDLEAFEEAWTLMLPAAPSRALQARIAQRLRSLANYKAIQKDFVEVKELIAATDARDRALQSRAASTTPVSRGPAPTLPSVPVPTAVPVPPPSTAGEPAARSHNPAAADPRRSTGKRTADAAVESTDENSTEEASAEEENAAEKEMPDEANRIRRSSPPVVVKVQRSFSGAGIVQRVEGGPADGPQFVLAAPDGRILAYLRGADGVDLSAVVGKAVGVSGPRAHDERFKADWITVEAFTPVRLAQRR
jgi:hypothetical protein